LGLREPARVVAIIAANPALSSILGMMLAADPKFRVRQFESAKAIETYMRIAPVDLVVADFDCEEAPADTLARQLKTDEFSTGRPFQVIALAHKATPAIKLAALRAGISEVIVKPMSPRYLLERVRSRLMRPEPPPPRERRPVIPALRRDNVVPLFPLGTPS
jgi:DNA-binding response OmpR family regulator